MPQPARKRQKSIASGVDWNAITNVASEYQTRAKVKIVRRQNRADSELNSNVPANMPIKVEAMRLAKPLMSKKPCVVGVKIFAANRPGAIYAISPLSNTSKTPPSDSSSTRYQMYRVLGRRSIRA